MLIKLLNYLLFLFYLGCASLPSEEDRIIEDFDPKIPVQKIIEIYRNDQKKKYDIKKIKILLYNFNKAIIYKDIELLFSLFNEDVQLNAYYNFAENDYYPQHLRQDFELYKNYSDSKLNQITSLLITPYRCDNRQIPKNVNADLFRFLFYSKKIIWKSSIYNRQIEYDSYRTILLNNPTYYHATFGFNSQEKKGSLNFKTGINFINILNLDIVKDQNSEYKIKKIDYGQLYFIQLYDPDSLETMKKDFLKRNEKFKKEQIELGNKDFME